MAETEEHRTENLKLRLKISNRPVIILTVSSVNCFTLELLYAADKAPYH